MLRILGRETAVRKRGLQGNIQKDSQCRCAFPKGSLKRCQGFDFGAAPERPAAPIAAGPSSESSLDCALQQLTAGCEALCMEVAIKKTRFEWLIGFNCIWNALSSSRRSGMSLFYVEDPADCQQRAVLKDCFSKNIPVQNVYTERQLTKMTRNTQMNDYFQCKVALKCSPLPIAKWNPVPSGKRWLALHHVQDPQNLGAIIRTGHFFGVDGILLTDKASATPTPAVSRASAGVMEVAPIYTVGSMLGALETFKGLDIEFCALDQADQAS